ncbi:hypothetical protein GPJ56_008958 [Histomonas meleagridis]|uniref:uncharacterized protein n=1 Tax=Histomonas meleagridis TaxID=135588 RepID=UPI0035597638|nr:hypothetical protein GPJ56_008958 [Histomonas meleagridis]KAH0805687.1 hypothetical protein GO595_001528 [Histomonas meleagridis]
MDELSTKFNCKVGMIYVDIGEATEIVAKYRIEYSPQIVVFRHDKLIKKYYGQWTASSISRFCDRLISSDITYLNSTFDVFKFQHRSPANLILSSNMVQQADKILYNYGGAFHIGVITNDTLSEQLGLPPAIFTRPKESFSREVTNLNTEDLVYLSTSPYVHIKNQELVGSATIPNTLLALVDEKDPIHLHDVIVRMQAARDYFVGNLSFQYCDFNTCSQITQQIGLANSLNPIFLINIKYPNGQQIFEPFRKVLNTPNDLLTWLKLKIQNIEEDEEDSDVDDDIIIPKLRANEFMQKALDENVDAVLFVADSKMKMYNEAKRNMWITMKTFEDIKTVKFFEFNPYTENVPGLSIPESDMPQVSIWPATKEYNGRSFTACISAQEIMDNLLKWIKTKVDSKTANKMLRKMEKLLRE